VLRSNILVFPFSIVPGLSRSCFIAALSCSVAACNVYSPDLMNGGALTTGGSVGQGGTGIGEGGTLGASASSGESGVSGQAGSLAGGMDQGGASGAGEVGGDGSVSGGTTGVAGSAAGGSGGGVSGSGGAATLDLIDNLEDNDATIRLVNNPERNGIWDTGNDKAVGGKQTPAPGMFKPTALLPADAPYAGDKFAAYSKASGFTAYGAFMNVSMRSWPVYDTTYPKYDASGYKGLSFWAKAGTGSSLGMRLRFISGDTDPRGGKCKLATDVPAPPANQLCYNHYYAAVTLSTSWQLMTLSFTDDFFQGMDGLTSPTIDLKEMYGLEFYFSAGNDFEIWIDDLSFVKN
jgi:hypothetical protein